MKLRRISGVRIVDLVDAFGLSRSTVKRAIRLWKTSGMPLHENPASPPAPSTRTCPPLSSRVSTGRAIEFQRAGSELPRVTVNASFRASRKSVQSGV